MNGENLLPTEGSKTFPGSNNIQKKDEATCLQTNNVDLTTSPSHESHTVIEYSMVQEKGFTIDVDAYQPNEKWPNDWVTEIKLTEADRRTLMSSSAWISDAVINAAQTLLKKETPYVSGLQNVNLGLNNSFDVETGEFVQILHNGQNHWQVISTIGVNHPSVNIFNSMYCHCSTHTKVQIESILATKEPAIRLQYIDVQMQSGQADCGLFAIAFAATLVHGMHPGSYIFEQSLMRPHLLKCLENGKITMFPIRKNRRVTQKIKRLEEFKIYCTCRMPVTPESDWIQCIVCKEWYHTNTCVNVEPIYKETKARWLCSLCK